MKFLPEPGTIIRWKAIDNFTGEEIERTGRVIGEASVWFDEHPALRAQGYEFLKPGEAVICGPPRFNWGGEAVVFKYEILGVVEGPETEIPNE